MRPIKNALLTAIGIITGLSGCSPGPVKTTQPPDLSKPGRIELKLEAPEQAKATAAVKRQVSLNLQDWDYPMGLAAGQSYSHILTATIGRVEHGSTPIGFSFSPGNSDPRALDFQKADVLPIGCRLTAIDRPEQSAELNMGFSDSAVTAKTPDAEALADHVSTVCFNLLRELDWPVKPPEAGAGETKQRKPVWMPEIRIETEEEPAPAPTLKREPFQTPKQKAKPSADTGKPITREITKQGRKIYIIHNHGNPVIFKFGHERK